MSIPIHLNTILFLSVEINKNIFLQKTICLNRFFIVINIFFLFSCYSGNRYSTGSYVVDEQTDYDYYSSNNLDSFVATWLGTPYKYGGMSKKGIDCSGLAYLYMLHVYKKKIPRTSRQQYYKGRKINRFRLMKGDLIFFKGMVSRGIDHVGIYLGDNQFVHASRKEGVIISDLSEKYYNKRYVGACRY
jgi:hypothetical protein